VDGRRLLSRHEGRALWEDEGIRSEFVGRRWLRVWEKPAFEEISLCAEVTAYVYTK
jgi:coenzyme PQQ precursor peptide PqqA